MFNFASKSIIMGDWWKRIPVRLTLFVPIFLGIVLAIGVSTLYHIRFSRITMEEQLQESLLLEVRTLVRMFERERSLMLDRVKTNLEVAHAVFHSRPLRKLPGYLEMEATNQISRSSHPVKVQKWAWGKDNLHDDHSLVDSLQALFGGTVTIFQKIDSGYVRISTNVPDSRGARATGTYIPFDSPVVRTIEQGETYYGRAFVVNDWYITAYEPVYLDGELSGILYVGNKEKDLDRLREILYSLRIGKSGFPFVFDPSGTLVMHPRDEGRKWKDFGQVASLLPNKESSLVFKPEGQKEATMLAFEYYEPFDLYVAAEIKPGMEIRGLSEKTLLSSGLVGLIIIALFSVFVYYITNEKIRDFFRQIEVKDRKLSSARSALKESESRFRFLFDSTTDDIFVTDLEGNFVEVNHSACENLGYEHEELLKMNMEQVKSDRFREQVRKNRERIIREGKMTYESEHLTHDGRVFPVEMKSSLINLGESRYILSAARNVTERKELERKILSAVIQAEEKERERFSRDMHDGLGPLLSTIKLYVNELGAEDIRQDDKMNYVKYTSDLVDEAISNTRDISNNLMPRMIHDYGLVTALEAFCKKVNLANKISIQFDSRNMYEPLERNIQLILFRVVSELINNTIRHAGATEAVILLERTFNRVLLHYVDNGKGFEADNLMDDRRTGMGLKNIISRIKSINGTCRISSEPGQGSRFEIEVEL